MGGGDKCLRLLGGRTLLERVIERVRPQVGGIILNANGDPARFGHFGLPVVADGVAGFAGPLAGVLAGLDWAAEERPDLPWLVSIATDTPFFPSDLVARLVAATEAEGADLACAASGGRTHPVFGLWPVRLKDDLRRALVDEGLRKIDAWTARYRLATVTFPAEPVDPFLNVNTPDDLAEAERLAPGGRGMMARTLPERAAGAPRAGLAAMAGCFLIWAAYPFLFRALTDVGPLEIVAQRALWSAVALACCLPFGGLRREVPAALRDRRSLAVLLVTAALIMANWLVYVLAVVQNRVLEASLGYFLGPLVSVAIGMAFLGERLRPWQWAAVGVALLAVLNLLLRQDHLPLLALFLAVSFSSYGAIRKGLRVGPLAGMFVECLIALPFGLAGAGLDGGRGHAGLRPERAGPRPPARHRRRLDRAGPFPLSLRRQAARLHDGGPPRLRRAELALRGRRLDLRRAARSGPPRHLRARLAGPRPLHGRGPAPGTARGRLSPLRPRPLRGSGSDREPARRSWHPSRRSVRPRACPDIDPGSPEAQPPIRRSGAPWRVERGRRLMPQGGRPLRVAVVGGSVAGLGAAMALRGAGCDVDVYERAPGPMADRGAGIVVQDDLLRLLARDRGAPELPATACLRRRYLLPDGGDGGRDPDAAALHLLGRDLPDAPVRRA